MSRVDVRLCCCVVESGLVEEMEDALAPPHGETIHSGTNYVHFRIYKADAVAALPKPVFARGLS